MAKRKKRPELTDRQLRDYYDKHSLLGEGVRIRPVKMEFRIPRVLIALRMDEETLEGLKRVAQRKGLNYSTLARMWITERLREEKI
jgi:predicted DNA binding CopG/RHH family protein